MHLGAELLELLLVADAEMLLLVDDQQTKVLELDGLAEQRMGADDDVDLALGQAFPHLRQLLGGYQPRRLPDLDREAMETLGERLGVLARQQRSRNDYSYLLAVHRGGKGRAQRHFGLAEADVTADQAIHRPAGSHVLEHRVDGGLLVLGFLIGEAGAEFLVRPLLRDETRGFAQQAFGGNLDERMRDFADALLHARLACLPGAAAEPVELDAGLLRAVARQELDVLDR